MDWTDMDLDAMDMDDMDMDYEDATEAIREIAEYSRMPVDDEHEHPYVVMGGVEIDAEIAGLIQTLWDMGIETEGSCQGDVALGDPVSIAFASPEGLARVVSMIVDHEVTICDGNGLMYYGTLILGAPGQPVELPHLPMGAERVLWEDEEDGSVGTEHVPLECVCHVVGGEIRNARLLEWRYNPMTQTAGELRDAHEHELERFRYPWAT